MKWVWTLLIAAALVIAFAFFVSMLTSGAQKAISGHPDIKQVERDPKVATAVLTAQHTLDKFIAAYQRHDPQDKFFGIRAKFETPKGQEFIWVHLDSYEGGKFVGHLQDEPYAIEGKHKGDTVTVKRDDVTDWIYKHGDKTVGGFTIAALQQ